MPIKSPYAIACFSLVALVFVSCGYLMLFDPSKYADLRNWHFRRTGLNERITIERCSRMDHRVAGLGLFIFGVFMLYVLIRGFLR